MSRAEDEIQADFKGLDDHIKNVVAPNLAPLEGRRKQRYWMSRIVFLFLALVITPYSLHMLWNTTITVWGSGEKMVTGILFGSFGLVGAGMLGSAITKGVKTDGKNILMTGITDHLGWSFNVEPEKPTVMEHLTAVKMHYPLSIEEYEDAITGEALRHKFTMTEASLACAFSSGKGSNKKSFDFKGVILSVAFPKRVFGMTILRRIADNLTWQNIKALKTIQFASPEFTKAYEVFGNDPVEAYYLFSPDIMVTLLDAASDMGGKLAACVFLEDSLTLLIATDDKFEMKTTAKTFANDAQFEKVKKDIGSVYKMIEKVEYYLTHRDPNEFG